MSKRDARRDVQGKRPVALKGHTLFLASKARGQGAAVKWRDMNTAACSPSDIWGKE